MGIGSAQAVLLGTARSVDAESAVSVVVVLESSGGR